MKTKHTRFTRNAAFGAVATLLIAAAGFPALAFADLCHSPDVTVINEKPNSYEEMEVDKFMYYDGCQLKWRTEDVNDEEISVGDSATFDDNLEYVEGCELPKFRLFRRVRGSNGAWGSKVWGGEIVPEEGSNVECITGQNYTLHNP